MGDVTTLSHVELGVLGPLQVRQYGLPVAVPGAKPRAVLTMLGLHGGSVVTADALAELLWGARPPRTAVKALQTHISSLRRALGDGYVLTEGTGWTLSTTEIDATRYKLAARQGRDAFAGGDAGQAVARFDEALALWRGVPELPDGPRGGSEKTRWIEGHAALVEDRADALLATGRAAEIVGELEAAIADAPLRERRWSQLMLALYRAGRQGEALAAFQRARSMLRDELGVDPGPDLRRLEAAIVAQDVALEIAVPEQLSVVTRAVTFLLTDIEGSTAAWEADADAMATALARHDEIVEQVVTARGGRLVKTRGEGDATFSVFDRPSAAAAAAIELQEAIRHEPWVLAEPMRIRVALHTGEVELRDGDYFGRAVNRAARLRSLAEGGQILCSGATAELVIDTLSDDVMLADLGVRHLRNLARPEHVFELRLETPEDSVEPEVEAAIERPLLPAVLAGPGPFVGRVPELEGLLAAWESTLAAGARAVLISGEPGVGKTRLAGEWSRLAYEQGAIVLYGRCDEDLGAAYQPFAEALRSLVPCLGADRLRGTRGIEAVLPLVPGLTDAVPDLPTPARSDPDTERYALFDAVVALLAMASASAPVVLILDDLHWAAKPTLLLLRHVLRFGEHARVQIVGTYRSTDLDRSHPLAAMLADLHRDGSASRLALGGLDEDDVTTYVAEVGYDDVELARALASVTGGNPFFLIEALRHVAESGGRWDPSTLPQGVREAVSRRLSRLPAETNKALAAAAVVGARFSLALVEQVMGEDLIDAFDEACKAGIVIEEPGGRYRFNHALVRQSLLAELASVRRMRLHQKIATTLEAESGADNELLAELAYHYFECAWAGNAAKAVEYCRRAADQAMERLSYEGAADLYDRALHALEELDDELPDRDALQAELLVARCEALLAAGDVGSAAGAVAQLQRAAGDSVRLAAWGTSFDGQLSMLTDPERLDEIESEVSAAAQRLAELDDAAGEANAHTVRAACLARLGRIADAETALDQALTAARRARDHRRVNAVLAGAPLAALWGPNPVPRAGGRCLDVVRLLRITTGSPVVEATSTRCQGVLDAMRGRAAAGRQLIDSARRTLTELGMRHALLEVDQFAGIVELVADDPAAAEPHLRRAYDGFRRMGLDADTAETAAFLARTCLLLDRDAEADELCRESERLAGHALRPSITWRTVRALLHARGGAHGEARRVAEEAATIAERTDALIDHGDACLTLAVVLSAAGDVTGARAAAEQAVALFERKGAAALVERARGVLGAGATIVPSAPEKPVVEPENECVRVLRRVEDAVTRRAWSEVAQEHAEVGSIESRRKIVGFERIDLPAIRMASGAEKFIRDMRAVRTGRPIVAVRGERLALTRTHVGTADDTPGAPLDEMLQLVGLDEDGRIALQIWFDVDDLDAAIAEMDALYARFGQMRTACVRAIENVADAVDRRAWDEIERLLAQRTSVESRRKVVGFARADSTSRRWLKEIRRYVKDLELNHYTILTVRGDRFALVRLKTRADDPTPGAPRDDVLDLVGVDEEGRVALQVFFDVEDMDAAVAELDAVYAESESQRRRPLLENDASRADHRINKLFAERRWDEIAAQFVDDIRLNDRRRGFGREDGGRDQAVAELRTIADLGVTHIESDVVALRGGHLVLTRVRGENRGPAAFFVELLRIAECDAEGRIMGYTAFDVEDIDAATAELDAAYARFQADRRPVRRLENTASRLYQRLNGYYCSGDWVATSAAMAPDIIHDDRRRAVNGGVRRGRDLEIENAKAAVGTGADMITSTVVAVRGERLALCRSSIYGRDDQLAAFSIEMLNVVEIDVDERLTVHVILDPDDLDGAFAELDARYLAGEAAPHAHAWSVVTDVFHALNRHEFPDAALGWVSIDHRRGTPLAHTNLKRIVASLNELTPDLTNYVEKVHLLRDHGVVFTQMSRGTSPEGFDAEWRILNLLTVDGDVIDRCELFDDADLDAAVARLEELSRTAGLLDNEASRAYTRMQMSFSNRDWDELEAAMAAGIVREDHRRVVSAEAGHDRGAAIAEARAVAELGALHVAATTIATRGESLAIVHSRFGGNDERPDAFRTESLVVVELNRDGRISAHIMFDFDDTSAAFAELEARYIAAGAGEHAHRWSVITEGYAALNRREIPASTPNLVNVDRRRGTPFASGDLIPFIHASWADTPINRIYVRAVYRLTETGALVASATSATSHDGFDAEWREICLLMFEGDMFSRIEVFDEGDLDAARARFDELSRPGPQLENDATRTSSRFDALFNARDWPAISELYAEDVSADDRRRVTGGGPRVGRDAEIANLRAMAEFAAPQIDSTVLAIRGSRLALFRSRALDDDMSVEDSFLSVLEINADNRIVRVVGFDTHDVDAAFAELDSRYGAGEAAAHADTWSVITSAYAAVNRHELPPWTPDTVDVDHRSTTAFSPGDLAPYLHATWDQTPDVKVDVVAVHRLTDVGAVVTHVAKGTAEQGFEGEWREITLSVVEGDRISRSEMFGESDLDAALARFDDLTTRTPQPENAATRAVDRFNAHFAARDWDAVASILADDVLDDDRRRVVNSGVQRGRDVQVANLRTIADLGMGNFAPKVVAIRGDRLALTRTQIMSGHQVDKTVLEPVSVCEVNSDGQVSATVHVDDFEDAIAELDTRYMAGEAAPYARTWSVVSKAYVLMNQRGLPATTSDWVDIDHRRGATFASGEMTAYVRAAWEDLEQNLRIYVESVHRLTDLGTVVTQVLKGTTREGFDAEWRTINLFTVKGELFSRCELFDESDLDVALAKFDELNRPAPRIDNMTSRMVYRYMGHFAARDWDTMRQVLAEDFLADDRRRVVNSGGIVGRDAEIANVQAFAEVGCTAITSTPVAARGEHLLLTNLDFSISGWSEPMDNMSIVMVETNVDDQIAALVVFESDDIDSAIAELDTRYLAGEAAAHADTWSVIMRAYDSLNRREIPGTTMDWVNIDHRQARAFESGDMVSYIRASWDVTPNINYFCEAVHRLSDLGAVVTRAAQGTSQGGFDAEWREITVLMVDGDLISRCEMYDEADLDAAIARFDELSTTTTRLENAASRVEERCQEYIAAGDWDAMAAVLAENVSIDDRRRVVNAGLRHGRQAVIDDLRVGAEIGLTHITPTALAIRGERLTLRHIRYWGGTQRPDSGLIDLVQIVEIDADERIKALVLFEADDIVAAVADLDARYIAGEAADHARTWTIIAENCAALNQQVLPAPPDFVYVDRRQVANIGAADVREFFRAAWELTPDMTTFVEAVHRLTDVGAVVSQVAQGTSRDGFYAEWRVVNLYKIDGDLLGRCEVFDETDLDIAIARFEELSRQPQPVENTASRMYQRFLAYFRDRDWNAMAEMVALDNRHEDRRRVVNAGIQHGRDTVIASMRAIADVGVTVIDAAFFATRGDRLALARQRVSGGKGPDAFGIEVLIIAEVGADGKVGGGVAFDIEEIDAAFAELDARYLAGEAAPYADAWSVIANAYATLNRREIPATTSDWTNIDHRRVKMFAPGDLVAFVGAAWDLERDILNRVETVHRLNGLGAVITRVSSGTSNAGFDAEWREVDLMSVKGDLISRFELFDEEDLDAALARFDELSQTATRFVNTAGRVADRFRATFAARDWRAMAEMLAEDIYNEDRRPVVNAGIRYGRDSVLGDMRSAADIGVPRLISTDIATRGERLVLVRAESPYDVRPEAFYVETLAIAEIDAGGTVTAQVIFGVDDLDAAFEELDKRYVAGEAAAYADTWSVIANAYAALNRHEIPSTTPEWVNIDHRRGGSTFETGDMATYIQASWEDSPQNKIRVETVHRLSHLGAVVTSATRGVSVAGFYAEWRQVDLVTVDGNVLCRTELFDEQDLEVALARFDELSAADPRLENAASRAEERARKCFASRDWASMADCLADRISFEDRRRVVNAGTRTGRIAAIADARTVAELGGTDISSQVIAIRGDHLVLARSHLSSRDRAPDAFQAESLCVTAIAADGRIATRVVFDPENLDGALAELDARYIADEEAAHAYTWSLVTQAYAAFNRHEFPPGTTDFVSFDHRRVIASAPEDMAQYVHAVWELAPDAKAYVERSHRLSKRGAVVVAPAQGTSQEGFDAEWREVHLLIFDGGLLSHFELFDETDVDAAVAKFDELTAPMPRLDNAATRGWRRFSEVYNRRDLDGFLAEHETTARYDDRRMGLRDEGPVGPEVGRALLFEASPSWRLEIEPIATRGEALALIRGRFRDIDEPDGPSAVEVLAVVEVSDRELLTYEVFFDPEDLDSALTELDARFLTGKGADETHIWTRVKQTYARFNRHELSPTTPEWVNIDHRRSMVPAPGEMREYVSAMWSVAPDVHTHIDSVHRLTSLGAVFTHAEVGTSDAGFDAEWREVTLLMFDGDLISRCELYDENDLEAALSRFDELSVPARQLDNAATRADVQAADGFNSRDLDGYLAAFAENAQYDDRRKGLRNAGPIDRELAHGMLFTGALSWQVEIVPVAIRGGHLALTRHICRDTGEAEQPVVAEVLALVETNDSDLICRSVLFDPDDVSAAVEELNDSYLGDEAAQYGDTWSAVAQIYAGLNRQELPAWITDVVHLDHRTVVTIDPNDLAETLHAAWDLVPDLTMYVEGVHRLTEVGAVVTNRSYGTSKEGFDAEWRMIQVLTVARGRIDHFELFDECDIDAALARLDELSRPETKLANAATRARAYACDVYNRHDKEKFTALAIGRYEDRRKGLRYEGAADRDFATSIVSETPTSWHLESEPVGIRGARLALSRDVFRDTGDREPPIPVEMLVLTDITDESVVKTVLFDPDDIDAAFAELTARWIASGDVEHPAVIRAAQRIFETFNRHDWETFTTYLRDATYVSHRQLGIDDADISDYLLSVQMWVSLIPDLRTEAAEVLAHSAIGGVVSAVLKGTSTNGTVVEIPSIVLALNDGDRVTHLETYDPEQRDMALARFDELSSRG